MLSECPKAVPLLSMPQACLYINNTLECVFVCVPVCLSVVYLGQKGFEVRKTPDLSAPAASITLPHVYAVLCIAPISSPDFYIFLMLGQSWNQRWVYIMLLIPKIQC